MLEFIKNRIYSFIPSLTRSDRDGLIKVGKGFCNTSVNTSVFRRSSIVSNKDFQFIAFYNKNGYIVLGKRKLDESKWKLKKLPIKGKIIDAHNVISLGLDGDGYLHMAYNMHNATLNYVRSLKPGSLNLTQNIRMDGIEEDKVTYPEFHTLPEGDLLFVYRSGKSGNGNMVLKRYFVKEKKWITIHKSLIDGEGQRNAYWQTYVDGHSVHVAWVWRESPDVLSNHDLCYAVSKDAGLTWQKSDGTPYKLPITTETAETIIEIPQNSQLMNQTGICSNKNKNPFIATYWQNENDYAPQYRIVWHNGIKWNCLQMGTKKIPFDLRGRGTKMVPISRPVIVTGEKNSCYVLFRDEERESKVSMAYTEDITNGKWEFRNLTKFKVDAWEPTIDWELWKREEKLNIFVQSTHQKNGDNNRNKNKSSMIYVLEVQCNK